MSCILSLAAVGCVAYEPQPLDAQAILAAFRIASLDDVRPQEEDLSSPPSDAFDPSDGLTIREAVTVAVVLNPSLQAARAEVGVAQAQLVEAGLLPDASLEWDVSDATLDIFLPLLRPGERDAALGVSQAVADEVRVELQHKEWILAREVGRAWLDVLAARERLALNQQLMAVVQRTAESYGRSQQLGAVTAVQASTARVQAAQVALDDDRLRAEEARAWRGFVERVGLPPEARFELQVSGDLFSIESDESTDEALDPARITARAVENRPDLLALLARYHRAEESLRLETARQSPEFGIGTQFGLVLPFFGRWNRPAWDVAFREREVVRSKVEVAIFALRAEVFEAVAWSGAAKRRVRLAASIDLTLRESIEQAEAALASRQLTSVDLLVAQSEVLDVRMRVLEARIEMARADLDLRWVTGDSLSGEKP